MARIHFALALLGVLVCAVSGETMRGSNALREKINDASSVAKEASSVTLRDMLLDKSSAEKDATEENDTNSDSSLVELGEGEEAGCCHIHWPHGHWPHGHVPHPHWPHAHVPHVHVAHVHVEALLLALVEPALDAITDALEAAGQAIVNALPDFFLDAVAFITSSDPIEEKLLDIAEWAADFLMDAAAKAASAVTDQVNRLVSSIENVYENHIRPVIDMTAEFLRNNGVTANEPETCAYMVDPAQMGFEMGLIPCPYVHMKEFCFPHKPTVNVCISHEMRNAMIGALAEVINLVTPGAISQSTKDDIASGQYQLPNCPTNFGMTFLATVDAGMNVGVVAGASASAGAAMGIAIGCENGAYKLGLVAGVSAAMGISLGANVAPVSGEAEGGVTIQFFPPGTACDGWGCIPGQTLEFSAGVSGTLFGFTGSADITVITSVPRFSVECEWTSSCSNHLNECLDIPLLGRNCMSTHAIADPFTRIHPSFTSNYHEICLNDIPAGLDVTGFDWQFMGVAISLAGGFHSEAAELEVAFNIAVGHTDMLLQVTLASQEDQDCDGAADSDGAADKGVSYAVTGPAHGCPDRNRGANTVLLSKTVNMASAGSAFVTGSEIRHASGRADLHLYVDGVVQRRGLTFTPSAQWDSVDVTWAGTLGAGSHTFELKSPNHGVFGCGTGWGSLNVITQ